MIRSTVSRRRACARAGFTIVETAVATTVLVIGVLGYVAAVTTGDRLMLHNRESRRAYMAAQTVFAEMQAQSIATVFQCYNATTSDDPAGGTTAPGATFTANGVGSCAGSASEGAGTVRFPTRDGTTLREDVVDAALGMPRDLDGDGVISSGPLTTAPLILPVELKVSWDATGGRRAITLRKFLFAGGAP